jgi:hypothetical protein
VVQLTIEQLKLFLKQMGKYEMLEKSYSSVCNELCSAYQRKNELEAQVKRMNEDSLNCVHIPYDKEDLLDKIRYYHGHNRVEIDENGKIIYPLKHIEGIDWYRELVNEAVERMSGETHLSWSDAVEDAIGDNTYHDEKNDWVCWGEKPDEE